MAAEPDLATGPGGPGRRPPRLLDDGGNISFWENGWLRDQLERWGSH